MIIPILIIIFNKIFVTLFPVIRSICCLKLNIQLKLNHNSKLKVK
jgi:hypothetical protein